MENIGLANVFHEFPRKKQWKTLAKPMFSMNLRFSTESSGISPNLEKNQKIMQKTLAWLMFSMNFHEKTMENIGQANAFHESLNFKRTSWDQPGINEIQRIHGKRWPGQCFPLFFHGNSWKTLARRMFSMIFSRFGLIPGDSVENRKFMKHIGLANVFHCFFVEIHGKHWPGECFP